MRIVALHGQMGMVSDWDGLVRRLDLEGHKLSAVDLWPYLEAGEISLEAFAEKLNNTQDDGQVLLGYSMGGRLALQALINQPEKWRATVIISAHIGLSNDERQSRRIIDDEWASKVKNLSWPKFLSEWNTQKVLEGEGMLDRSLLEVRKIEISRSFKCWSLAEQKDLLEQLSLIEIPVLWIVGGDDEKFCRQADRAANKLKYITTHQITNVGHRVPWAAETEILNTVTHWLDQLSSDLG